MHEDGAYMPWRIELKSLTETLEFLYWGDTQYVETYFLRIIKSSVSLACYLIHSLLYEVNTLLEEKLQVIMINLSFITFVITYVIIYTN